MKHNKQHIIQIRVDSDMAKWLDILESKYKRKRCHFIRDAILEKFQRDTKIMRQELTDLPF